MALQTFFEGSML